MTQTTSWTEPSSRSNWPSWYLVTKPDPLHVAQTFSHCSFLHHIASLSTPSTDPHQTEHVTPTPLPYRSASLTVSPRFLRARFLRGTFAQGARMVVAQHVPQPR